MVHCGSKAQAQHVLKAIAERMAQVGLELHPDKTRIVYCKDVNRKGSSEHERFNFLGYTFRPRRSKGKRGMFVNFSPAVSDDAKKAIRQEIRSWRLHRRSEKTLVDLARDVNPSVQGRFNYYGTFYKSQLYPALRPINEYLVRWALRKYKRLRGHVGRAWSWLASVARPRPHSLRSLAFGRAANGRVTGAR